MTGGSFEPQPRGEASTLPNFAVHFSVPQGHVICWLPCSSRQSAGIAENRTPYGIHTFAKITACPNQWNQRRWLRSDRIFSEPVSNAGFLPCILLIPSFHPISTMPCKHRWSKNLGLVNSFRSHTIGLRTMQHNAPSFQFQLWCSSSACSTKALNMRVVTSTVRCYLSLHSIRGNWKGKY